MTDEGFIISSSYAKNAKVCAACVDVGQSSVLFAKKTCF